MRPWRWTILFGLLVSVAAVVAVLILTMSHHDRGLGHG